MSGGVGRMPLLHPVSAAGVLALAAGVFSGCVSTNPQDADGDVAEAPDSDAGETPSEPDSDADLDSDVRADSDTNPSVDTALDSDVGDTDPPPVDYLVLHADGLAASAERYASFRATSGRTVVRLSASEVIGDSLDPAVAIREAIRPYFDLRDPERPFSVVILGDADRVTTGQSVFPAIRYVNPFDSAVAFTDNGYVDFDGDGIPDAGIGRIPADDDAGVDAYQERIAAFEERYLPGPWNHRVGMFASTSGFGEAQDAVIEIQAERIIAELPGALDVTFTYAKQTSPYVYIPEQFSAKVYGRLNEGALVTAYIGHGYPDGFADLEWSGRRYKILDVSDLSPLAMTGRSPVLAFVACSLGEFATGDSLAEKMILRDGGPVALLASSAVSHPYANALFIREFGQVMTRWQPADVGAAMREAKDRLVHNTDALHNEITGIASLFIDPVELASTLDSHQHYYMLFGDPGAALRFPSAAEVMAPASVGRGGSIRVSATFTGIASGSAEFRLLAPRDDIPGALRPVPADDDPARDGVIAANYAAANDKRVASASVAFSGAAAVDLAIPADISRGRYTVAVYASNASNDAIGSAVVDVR
jgi:hypothetical protein